MIPQLVPHQEDCCPAADTIVDSVTCDSKMRNLLTTKELRPINKGTATVKCGEIDVSSFEGISFSDGVLE